MKFIIKNMVTLRCIMVVKALLKELDIAYTVVELGEIQLLRKLPANKHKQLKQALLKTGLELMEDQRAILIEKIKAVVIEMVHYADELPATNFSTYISEKLDYDYNHLSHLFTEVKGITIEHFIILHKIEKVKELIIYDELNLSEIALKMHYSSSAHLSNQFKKVTGLTPSFFKTLKLKRRTSLDDV
jgi:AraC-like DNA-binding protein